jgi:flagellar hook assembly protein FlgD
MTMQSGYYTVSWSGKDNNGEQASHGTYFIHFKAGVTEEVKEVVLVK